MVKELRVYRDTFQESFLAPFSQMRSDQFIHTGAGKLIEFRRSRSSERICVCAYRADRHVNHPLLMRKLGESPIILTVHW